MADHPLPEPYRALRRGLLLRLALSGAFLLAIVIAGWSSDRSASSEAARSTSPVPGAPTSDRAAVAAADSHTPADPSAGRTSVALADAIRSVSEPQPLEGKSLEVLVQRSADETRSAEHTAVDQPGTGEPHKLAPATGKLPRGPHLQAGIFASPANAEEMKKKLEAEGYPVYLETRVHVGPFQNRKDADKARDKLKEQGTATLFIPQ